MRASLDPEFVAELPSMVAAALEKMPLEQAEMFAEEYLRRRRRLLGMELLAIFFPIQLFFLGRVGLGIAFLLTGGGLYVWWLIEIFLTPRRVRDYNLELATEIMRDIKILGS